MRSTSSAVRIPSAGPTGVSVPSRMAATSGAKRAAGPGRTVSESSWPVSGSRRVIVAALKCSCSTADAEPSKNSKNHLPVSSFWPESAIRNVDAPPSAKRSVAAIVSSRPVPRSSSEWRTAPPVA